MDRKTFIEHYLFHKNYLIQHPAFRCTEDCYCGQTVHYPPRPRDPAMYLRWAAYERLRATLTPWEATHEPFPASRTEALEILRCLA